MKKITIIVFSVGAFLALTIRSDANMLLLQIGSGSFGGGGISTTVITNDAATLNLTDDAGANTLVAQ